MSQHDAKARLQHMLEYAREAVELLGEKQAADVESDRVLQLALTRLVEVVGEAAAKLPAAFRAKHPDVPWREASSTRNLLIHGYDVVRYDILCQTIKTDFPPLIDMLESLLASEEF